jgi:hypothetical protein
MEWIALLGFVAMFTTFAFIVNYVAKICNLE